MTNMGLISRDAGPIGTTVWLMLQWQRRLPCSPAGPQMPMGPTSSADPSVRAGPLPEIRPFAKRLSLWGNGSAYGVKRICASTFE
jgi:hypothetical protein